MFSAGFGFVHRANVTFIKTGSRKFYLEISRKYLFFMSLLNIQNLILSQNQNPIKKITPNEGYTRLEGDPDPLRESALQLKLC